MTISLTTFFIVISFNTALTRDASQFFKFLCLLLLAVLILMSYRIMFELKNEVSENKDLSRQIKRDKLTGLKNRAAFKEDFRKAVANQSEFSCFFIDLDHFKKINDTYGHPAGDRYIKKFSQQLQIHEDKTSTFYRVSGDEFCCISYNTLHTEHVLRQINKNGLIVDNIPFEGFSYGYSKYPDDSEDATRLIEIADSRMYSNKRSKTRVIF